MGELRPAKRNVEVEVEVKAVDRFRYDASKSKGYVRLTATVLTNREAVHRKASFLFETHGAMVWDTWCDGSSTATSLCRTQ